MVTTLSQTIDVFFEARRAARYSENTLNEYYYTYKKFIKFLGDDPPIDSIDTDTITKFMTSEFVQNVSDKTALNYHTGLSSLWGWATKRGFVNQNIIRLVESPNPTKRAIIPYSRTELQKLLGASQTGRLFLRDEAILLTLLDTGMRVSELCGLLIKDLNVIERRFLVVGKGNKERELKGSDRTINSITTFLKSRNIHNYRQSRLSPVFITEHGNLMKRGTVRQLMDRLEDRSGVSDVHSHRFRHTFAINFLRNGGNIYSLQKILGHTTLDMVKRYLQIVQTDIDQDHDKASPVKNWNL